MPKPKEENGGKRPVVAYQDGSWIVDYLRADGRGRNRMVLEAEDAESAKYEAAGLLGVEPETVLIEE